MKVHENNNRIIGSRVEYIESTTSTNEYIKQKFDSGNLKNGLAVLASQQTKGKGFRNNKWESEAHKNITFSFIVYPEFLFASKQFVLSQSVSLAILDYLSSYSTGFVVKWPNDIYFKNKKIAGILIENSIQGEYLHDSIVGIGININQEVFSSALPNPISLKNITGKEFNIRKEFDKLLETINMHYLHLINTDLAVISESYLNNLYRINQWATYKTINGSFTGKIVGINEYGFLNIISKNNENLFFNFKEVEYVL